MYKPGYPAGFFNLTMNQPFHKTVIIIAGPTAVGKSAAAISMAKHFGTEIISADSRQCYKELNIGVARPSQEQLKEVPHYFIATHSVNEEVNAVVFEKYALEKVNQIHKHLDTVIMVGGTGLYIRAFADGLDDMPAVDPVKRSMINKQYVEKGLSWLQGQVKEKDPIFFEKGEILNPHRLIRALGIFETTGQSILSFQKGEKATRPFNIIKVALELPKENLHQNINYRTEEMIKQGLVDEVQSLEPFQELNALRTVGYTEIFNFLEQKISLAEAAEQIKINTRQYAKRQMTWFRKDDEIKWFSPGDVSGIISSLVNSGLGS